jgi:hypothetical protein
MDDPRKKKPPRIRIGEGTEDYDVEVITVQVRTTYTDHFKSFAMFVVSTVTALGIYDLLSIMLT